MKKYDVVVVGAGPAGSTVSILLKKKGYKVLLIDKEKFPREKLCGGLITNKTYLFLKNELNISNKELNKVINYSTENYFLYYKNELIFRGKSIKPFRLVDRKYYDFLLLNKVKEIKVDVLEGVTLKSIDVEKKELTLDDERINYKVLIGADGANSRIRSLFPKNILNYKYFLDNMVFTIEIRTDKIRVKEPTLYLGIVKEGYGWIFPNKNSSLIGIGSLKKRLKNNSLINYFADFLDLLDLDLKEFKNSIKGHPLPVAPVRNAVYKNILLLGDAAGLADPLLGEGIYYAHRSAKEASIVIDNFLKNKIPLESYNIFIRKLENRYKILRLLRKLAYFVEERNERVAKYFLIKLFNNYNKELNEVLHGNKSLNLLKNTLIKDFLTLKFFR